MRLFVDFQLENTSISCDKKIDSNSAWLIVINFDNPLLISSPVIDRILHQNTDCRQHVERLIAFCTRFIHVIKKHRLPKLAHDSQAMENMYETDSAHRWSQGWRRRGRDVGFDHTKLELDKP
ncbi:hypothetical protein T4D_7337 [Trichinella pseudospiralis]|uniref:Uncharacterized protein n=1 Tax=Trichinella pseudospiralis TaxID=6337 RepID=A0A0V1FNZ9_TRIPS|nr:hypothetical protein T4D_7337 [Trichinella pseudospiralis]